MLRKNYLEQMRDYYDSNLIKTLVGPRRCGKSELLKMIMEEIEKKGVDPRNIISINFEDLAYDQLKTYKDLNEYVLSKIKDSKEKYYLFLDEIQRIDQFERALASFKATLNCSLFVTGSDSKLLEGKLASLITGRIVEFKIFPFSYKETVDFMNLSKRSIPDDFFQDNYLRFGGYPQRFDYEKEDQILQYLRDLYKFVIENDVFNNHRRIDREKFQIISSYILKNCGKVFSPDSIWRYYKGNKESSLASAAKNTIYAYTDILKRVFLTEEEKESNIAGRKMLRGLKKFYAYDNGMRIIQCQSNDWDKGFFLENVVFNELIIRGYEVFYKEIDGRDLDFVVFKNNKQCYIQVCYSLLGSEKALEREYSLLEKIKDNYPKHILSLDREENSPFQLSRRGIRHINIEEFLLEKEDISLG